MVKNLSIYRKNVYNFLMGESKKKVVFAKKKNHQKIKNFKMKGIISKNVPKTIYNIHQKFKIFYSTFML
jgi:hypothetical protein